MSIQETLQLKPLELPLQSETPLVSVLVANYNYAWCVGDALNSVLAQTYPHFEVVVCDDGSSDGSRAIIEQYVKRDRRIRLICKENGGAASALNAAYAAAQGEMISLLDADDVFHPQKLKKIVSAFRNDPSAGLCIHQVLPVSRARKPLDAPMPKALESGWIAPQALRVGGNSGGFPPAAGLSFRRQVTDCIFPLPLQFNRGADGYLSRVAQFLTPVVAIPDTLADYRFHDANVTGATNLTSLALGKLLEDNSKITEASKYFLEARFGKEVADRLRLEDNHFYWELLLKLYILEGKSRGDNIRGYTVEAMLEQISQAYTHNPRRLALRKGLWRLLLALPPTFARNVLDLWFGMAPWKRIVRPVSRLWRIW